MFMKLLLTLLVIAGAVITLRMRSQRRLDPPAHHERLIISPQPETGRRRLWMIFAGGMVLLSLAGVGFYVYHQWSDSYQEVAIKVIDSRTGKEVLYKAYKGEIEGRSFTTLDGRRVSLAMSERMETSQ